jgi:hypothetical protein
MSCRLPCRKPEYPPPGGWPFCAALRTLGDMPHVITAGVFTRRGRGPEEIVLDGWLEDLGPYVRLDVQHSRKRGRNIHTERALPADESPLSSTLPQSDTES